MNNRFVASVTTILNLIVPGAGSIFGGRVSVGLKQLVLTAAAAVLLFHSAPTFQITIAALAAWLWAFTTSLELLEEAYDND